MHRRVRGMVAQAVINASRMNGRHAAMEGKTFPTTVYSEVSMSCVREPDLHGRISLEGTQRVEMGYNDDLSHAKHAS